MARTMLSAMRAQRNGSSLKLVEELRLLARAFVQDGIGQSEKPAARSEAVDVRAGGEFLDRFGLLRDGVAQTRLVHTGHVHLPDLLLERHSAQQIFHALLDGERGVPITGGRFGPRSEGDSQQPGQGKSPPSSACAHVLLYPEPGYSVNRGADLLRESGLCP